VMTDLGTLGGSYSYATGLSRDGSTVIGDSYVVGVVPHGFVWNSGIMTDVGTLGGGTGSHIRSVSDDGSVAAGYGDNGTYTHAFIWQGGVITDLGTLGGNDSHLEVHNLSGDGLVAGGVSTTAGGDQHAFRWESGVMSDLGTLGGTASGTQFVSHDGSVLLGYAQNVSGDYLYFRWDQIHGMQSLQDILTAESVDLTGWDLQAYGDIYISDNNKIITGTAQLNGQNTTFIMTDHAITTPQQFVAAVVPVSEIQTQIQGTINVTNDQSMMASRQALASFIRPSSFTVTSSAPSDLNDIPSAAGPDSGSLWDDHKFSAYVLGSWGIAHGNESGDDSGTGTAGFFYKVGDNLALGAGFIGGASRQDWRLGGDSHLQSYGGSLNLAYEGDQGIRIFGMASASSLGIDTNRHYMNGAGIDASRGDTDGASYGASLEGGYEFGLGNQFSMMPYASYEIAHATIDGYTETGGGFPAVFDSQSSTKHIGRLGTEISFKTSEDMKITAHADWAHVLHETGDDLSATVIGISQTVPYTKGEKDWAETGVTFNWNYTDDVRLIADVGTSIGNTDQPATTVSLGVTFGF